MTASTATLSRFTNDESPLRWLRPAEGWTTIAATAALPFALAWSLDDARWLIGTAGSTGYLLYLAVLSTLLGAALAKVGLGRWRAYLIGSLVGGLVIPFVAGGIVLGPDALLGLDVGSFLDRYRAMAAVVIQVWIDLGVNGQPFTAQSGHYHLVFAAIVWAAGLLAATAAIGRRRPLDAVVVTGLLLLTDEVLTAHEQLPILVFFSVAALVLLVRSHVLDEQVTWVRRRIGDPISVSSLYLGSGARFVGVAVFGALVLTSVASSAPLQGAWADVPQRLADVSRWLERFAPQGGDTRHVGAVGFSANTNTTGLFAPDPNKVAFVAHLPADDSRVYRWRAGTYAAYTNFGWNWGQTHTIPVATGAPLLIGTGDNPAVGVGTSELKFSIDPEAFIDATALSPATISSIDRSTSLVGVGAQTWFTSVTIDSGSGPYAVTATIPNVGDASKGLTANRLRAAGRLYPSDISQVYLQVPTGAMGPYAKALLAKVEDLVGGQAAAEAKPYDLARALEAYLHDSANFQYSADVRQLRDQDCSGISSVECFAKIHQGYCEYYASTMAILLRQAGIPTRIAYGFLPGERTTDGTETVMASAQHWWVEVYFPEIGWFEFDPTGSVGRPELLPSGAPVTPPPPGSFAPRESNDIARPGNPQGGAGSTGGGSSVGTTGPFAVVAVLLALALIVIVITARRRPRVGKPVHPDTAWGGLGRMAARFGFGPRPEQTVFEYAGALGSLVPTARVEVGTVAQAKVEVAYGHRELSEARLRSVGDAYRRLRLAVLRAGIARRFLRRQR
jgi:transglutaminase-like putative cysteine protease